MDTGCSTSTEPSRMCKLAMGPTTSSALILTSDHWRRSSPFLAGFLLSSALGCASRGTAPSVQNWHQANVHKILVACLKCSPDKAPRAEAYVAPLLRRQGFQASLSGDLLGTSEYSPEELVERMRQAQVDGIMEFEFAGEIPREGLPQGLRYRFHSVDGMPPGLSDRRTSVHAALRALIAGETR